MYLLSTGFLSLPLRESKHSVTVQSPSFLGVLQEVSCSLHLEGLSRQELAVVCSMGQRRNFSTGQASPTFTGLRDPLVEVEVDCTAGSWGGPSEEEGTALLF